LNKNTQHRSRRLFLAGGGAMRNNTEKIPKNAKKRRKKARASEYTKTLTPKFYHFKGSGLVGEGGFAFLRKSPGGCDSPPDCRQVPPFESTFTNPQTQKSEPSDRMSRFSVF
jgi:hypothetical protein